MTNIKGLIPGERVDIFGIVSSLQERTKKDGGTYIDLRLEDISGSVDCKIWDAALDDIAEIEVGKLVKARALVTEWNGKSQLNIQMIRLNHQNHGDFGRFFRIPKLEAGKFINDEIFWRNLGQKIERGHANIANKMDFFATRAQNRRNQARSRPFAFRASHADNFGWTILEK